jgi:MSHA biogenesis protein MshM
VVLFGQPELDERLADKKLRQLRQRITFSYHMDAIDREGLSGYIAHRLLVAGYQGQALFSQKTLDLLYKASRGIPRLVNILCHKTLMLAYGQGARSVKKQFIRYAAMDTEDVSVPGRWKSINYSVVILDVISVFAVAFAVYIFGAGGL